MNKHLLWAVPALAMLGLAGQASAQSPADFYKGHILEVRVGHGAGGGYDTYTRVMVRHMHNHVPGKPSIVVKNMTGAGGLKLAGYLANGAPRDGSIFGLFDRGGAIEPLLGNKGAKFDARDLTAIGSTGKQVPSCVAWHKAKVQTIQAAMKQQLIVGGTGPSATTTYPAMLNFLLGTKFKIIAGYKSSPQIFGAMERGEVEGVCLSWPTLKAARPDWVRDKKLVPLIQISFTGHPELKGVPRLQDVTKDEDAKKMLNFFFAPNEFGRPYWGPPKIPADRTQALRRAFDATMKDKGFLADAARAKMEVDPLTGEEMTKLVAELYDTPKALTAKVAKALAPFRGKKKKK
jgi:tripartite-type tricarboxylate transporter receptor subunit TctC